MERKMGGVEMVVRLASRMGLHWPNKNHAQCHRHICFSRSEFQQNCDWRKLQIDSDESVLVVHLHRE